MREAACVTASWREMLSFDARICCLNASRWGSGTQLKARVYSMCDGAVGAVDGTIIWEGFDDVVDVVIVDCPDGDTRVTVSGVVLLTWELAARGEGCPSKG